jgi:general secretion pathway protein A
MYEEFYKFTSKPFRLTPDPRFLYKSDGHSRALAYLRYGLHCGEGFVVVTGEVGTGKTTLLRTLMESLKSEPIAAAQITTTQIDSVDLLRLIASAFKLRSENSPKAQLLRDIEAFLLARAREKKRVLLIIDEAQNLPMESLEELRMLSNIQSGDTAILQSFLLGQGEFRETLRSSSLEQFRQRVLATYHLGPMNLEETSAYIKHRLGLVGWKGDPEITDDAFGKIYEYTGGIPRKINTFCDRLFLYGSLEELHKFDEPIVSLVIKSRQEEIGESITDEHGHENSEDNFAAEPAASGSRARLQLADNTISDTQRRLLALEKRVSELEGTMGTDRDRLAKFVMAALFSDSKVDISQLLESTRKEGGSKS